MSGSVYAQKVVLKPEAKAILSAIIRTNIMESVLAQLDEVSEQNFGVRFADLEEGSFHIDVRDVDIEGSGGRKFRVVPKLRINISKKDGRIKRTFQFNGLPKIIPLSPAHPKPAEFAQTN